MRFSHAFIALAFAVSGAACNPAAEQERASANDPATVSYKDYRNARFGFELMVPAAILTAQPAPQNADGRTWIAENGAVELRAFGSHNVQNRAMDDIIGDLRQRFSSIDRDRRTATSYYAIGQAQDGGLMQARVLRPNNARVLTVSFRYPEASTDRYAEIARSTVMSLEPLAQGDGPAMTTFEGGGDRFAITYDAAQFARLQVQQSFPHDYEQSLLTAKLIPRDRVATLGEQRCSYGESGMMSECEAAMEAGIGAAVVAESMSVLRAQIEPLSPEPVTLGGRSGFRITTQAEGSGANYVYLPLSNNDTLILYRMFRHGQQTPTETMFQSVLNSLTFT